MFPPVGGRHSLGGCAGIFHVLLLIELEDSRLFFRSLQHGVQFVSFGWPHYLRKHHAAGQVSVDVLDDRPARVEERRGFGHAFVRPHGLDRPAAEVAAERVPALLGERR
jgi:hypothetical protein